MKVGLYLLHVVLVETAVTKKAQYHTAKISNNKKLLTTTVCSTVSIDIQKTRFTPLDSPYIINLIGGCALHTVGNQRKPFVMQLMNLTWQAISFTMFHLSRHQLPGLEKNSLSSNVPAAGHTQSGCESQTMVIVVPQAVQKCRCPCLVVPGGYKLNSGGQGMWTSFKKKCGSLFEVMNLIELGNEHLIHRWQRHAATTVPPKQDALRRGVRS